MKKLDDCKLQEIIDNSGYTLTNSDVLTKLTEIVLYDSTEDSDLLYLSKNIGFDNMLKVFKLFSDKKKIFKDYSKIRDIFILCIIYYYRDIYLDASTLKKGLSWEDIQKNILRDVKVSDYKTRYLVLKKRISQLYNNFINENELKEETL